MNKINLSPFFIEQLGSFEFRTSYVSEYLGGRLSGLGHSEAYVNISYERDAYALQRRIRNDLIQQGYSR